MNEQRFHMDHDAGPIARASVPTDEPENAGPPTQGPSTFVRHDDVCEIKRARWQGVAFGLAVGVLSTLGLLVALGRLS